MCISNIDDMLSKDKIRIAGF